jgi:hypothetical protein
MVKPDGELNMESCLTCHEEDMTLSRSKLETCTLCHSQTTHAGSNEHVTANPASLKQAMEGRPADAPAMPLTDDGHIYCGTCHIFHDPHVMEEAWLTQGWLPADAGLSGAIRQSVLGKWDAIAARAGEKEALGEFATKGMRQLRLPIDDGQLCRQCHGSLR